MEPCDILGGPLLASGSQRPGKQSIHHGRRGVRDRLRMGQKAINTEGGEARLVHSRIRKDQAAWLDDIAARSDSRNYSEVMRRLIDVARRHEEELMQAS